MVSLFNVCTEVLDLVTKLDATQSFAWYSSNYYSRIVLLAAFCVLRIMRSQVREVINFNDAEQSLFKAINFVKNRSIQISDIDSRYATILKQLHSSSTAFKRDNGEIDGLHLDIRSRLVNLVQTLNSLADQRQFMSIAFDSFWWWRAEFDGRINPYQSPATTITNANSAALRADLPAGSPNMALESYLPDSFALIDDFANWDWPAGLTIEDGGLSLPPLE